MSRSSRSPGWRSSPLPAWRSAPTWRPGRPTADLAEAVAMVPEAGPRGSGGPATVVAGASRFAPVVAVVLLALIAARVAEIVPGAARVRPALLAAIIGGLLVLSQTSATVLMARLRNPVLRAFLMFGGWAVVTVPFALWPGHAANSIYPLFAPGLVMITVLALCPPQLSMLDRVTLGLVLSFGALFLSILSDSLVFGGRLYTAGSLDPNDLGSCAALVFPLAVMQLRRRTRLMALAAVSVGLLAVYVLLQTGSRGGTLAFAAATLVLCFTLAPKWRALAFVLLIVAVPLVWTIAPETFRQRVRSLTALENDYNTFDYYGRQAIWRRGIGYALRNPLTGVGVGNFDTAEGLSLEALGQRGKWSAPHSAYVQAFAELGFVGGFIWLYLIGKAGGVFLRLARNRDPPSRRPEYIAALVGWAVGAVFLSHAYFWAFFGLLALAALAAEVQRQAGAPGQMVAFGATPPTRVRGRRMRHG